ncbi:MAG: hypothetical protein Q8R00_02200 [Candidatus Nanoarchaeia archaeon]|nr:hypothetical protein [Candidatus Nanoarchaeia archaeon]
MKKALVVANNNQPELILDITARFVEDIGLKDLEVLRASSKKEALEHIAYGDLILTILEDELKEAEEIADSARVIGSKLIVLDSLLGNAERLKPYANFVLEKPLYFNKLPNLLRLIYNTSK